MRAVAVHGRQELRVEEVPAPEPGTEDRRHLWPGGACLGSAPTDVLGGPLPRARGLGVPGTVRVGAEPVPAEASAVAGDSAASGKVLVSPWHEEQR